MEIKNLIEVALAVLVGLALYPTIEDAATNAALNSTNDIAAAVIPLVPMIYVIILIAGCATYVYSKR